MKPLIILFSLSYCHPPFLSLFFLLFIINKSVFIFMLEFTLNRKVRLLLYICLCIFSFFKVTER